MPADVGFPVRSDFRSLGQWLQSGPDSSEKGAEVNPSGIDANYFYADFLANQGDYAKARDYLNRALAAPPRPGREDADAGRRRDIERLLVQINGKSHAANP